MTGDAARLLGGAVQGMACRQATRGSGRALQAVALGGRAEFAVTDWDRSAKTLVHVIPLDGSGPVRTFQAPNYFTCASRARPRAKRPVNIWCRGFL